MNSKNLSYAIAFVIAMFALSEFFGAHKYLSADQGLIGFVVIITSALVFTLSLCFMAFRIYMEEKSKNNLAIDIAIFNFIEQKFCNNGDSNEKR